MKNKNSRLDSIKMIISSKEIGSQEELLQELAREGFQLTQATLSRDLKQLKVAKAASMNGNYVYVLPNNTMYKRMTDPQSATEMLRHNGFLSIEFSANIAVIKTRPGYASSLPTTSTAATSRDHRDDSRRRHHHAGAPRRMFAHQCQTCAGACHSKYQPLI